MAKSKSKAKTKPAAPAQPQSSSQKKHLVAQGELNVETPLIEMVGGQANKYLLVNLIARRGRDLNRGDAALVRLPQPYSYTQLASAEMQQGKLKLQRKATSKVMVNLIESE
jgi:DNA-directed RNA polymerase subunit K/omega